MWHCREVYTGRGPVIQDFMDHPRWSECIFCMEIEGHPCPDNAYMVPESLYEEVNNFKSI